MDIQYIKEEEFKDSTEAKVIDLWDGEIASC